MKAFFFLFLLLSLYSPFLLRLHPLHGTPPTPGFVSSSALLHHLRARDSDAAEHLPHGFVERVAEGVHADGVDLADAVDLDQVALHARHHCPDVQEGQNGEEDAPDQCQRDAHQRRQQPVEPVLGDRERGEAGFPDSIKAVGACRLGDHVFKVHLRGKQTNK